MRTIGLAILVAASLAVAQTPAQPQGSISGTVRDAATGQPVKDVSVRANNRTANVGSAVTDAEGKYRLANLPAGSLTITARTVTKAVTLLAGENLTVDLTLPSLKITVSGKVLDENKEPVVGATVIALAKILDHSEVVYQRFNQARTNDKGEYRISDFYPGDSYLLLAKKEAIRFAASLDDPNQRKPELAPVFYPNSPDMLAAQTFVMEAGQNLEGIDFKMPGRKPFCAEGVSTPASLKLQITPKYPQMFPGSLSIGPTATTGADGKFRICGLHPGEYRLIHDAGSAWFTVLDEDVTKLHVAAAPAIPIPGDFVWDGTPPDSPSLPKVTVQLSLLDRPVTVIEGKVQQLGAQTTLPGEFTIPPLEPGDYEVHIRGFAPGQYIKEATYGGNSVLTEALHLGKSMGYAGLHIVIARDGATLGVQVQDADQKPRSGVAVYVMPERATSEAVLQATMTTGQTDQYGGWTSPTVRPGKYYVLAAEQKAGRSPEAISRLWNSRLTQAREVDLGPGSRLQINLIQKQ